MACRRDAPPGFRAAPRAAFVVTAIRHQSLMPSRLRACGAARWRLPPGEGPRGYPRRAELGTPECPEPAAPDRPGQRLVIRAGFLSLRPGRSKLAFGLAHQHYRAAFKRASDLEDDRQRGHVLAALDLAHVRTLNAGEVRQRFLRDPTLQPQRTYRRAEGQGQFGVEGGGAGRAATLDSSLLQRQKRQVTA